MRLAFPINSPTPATITAVTADKSAPQLPGNTVTFTASATGGNPPYQFKWWVYDGTTWTIAQDWSASSTFAWTPTVANAANHLSTWVRSSGNVNDLFESYQLVMFPIIDLRGVYTVSASITQSACSFPADNGALDATGNLSISNQAGGSFSGTATLNSMAGGIPVQQAIVVSGTVNVQSQLSGSFTFTTTANGSFVSSGDGTFGGAISGNRITVPINGQVRVGETCQLTGTLMGTR